MAKRQKRVVGDVARVDLGDGYHVYGRVLDEAMFAFYDLRVRDNQPIELIICSSIMFFVPVMKYAITRGHWKIIGNAPLDDQLKNPPPRFIQDALQPEDFSIYEKGKIRPSTRAECIGLEREAVWDPEHVEDRLRDHYAGRKNKWLESLRMK